MFDQYLPSEIKETTEGKKSGGAKELKKLLDTLKGATEKNDPVKTKQILADISSYKFSGDITESISKLKDAVSAYDFKKVNKIIDAMNKSLKE